MLERRLERPAANVIHFLVGTAHLHLGNFRQTIHHLETALSLYDEKACRPVAFVNGYHLRSFTLIWLSLGYLYVGEFEQAAATMRAAVADARSRSHPFTLVSALLAQARFLGHRNDLAGAVAATEEGWAVAAEQRSPYHLSRAGILRAVNALDGGDAAQAIALMEQALIAHPRDRRELPELVQPVAPGRGVRARRATRACAATGGRCGRRGRALGRALVGSRGRATARRNIVAGRSVAA
jgi:tetratricopeptide (TPR) repeat protein